ncbi:MAG: hypothetical protein JW940_19190 [Polyangiaceae bacterium]|nr:hypothetical protein [Polyangiaceae bacterium]
MNPIAPFLRRRAPLILLSAAVAVAAECSKSSPPPRTLQGVAELLGEAAHATVQPKEIAWEPSSGVLLDLLVGRRVLFLAAERPGEPRDLYRAWVRVSADGAPLSVARLRNLTRTPLGDESALLARRDHAVFATSAYGKIQSITHLELGGTRDRDRPSGRGDRVLLSLSEFQRSGDLGGLGRSDIVFTVPPRSASLTLADTRLDVDVGQPGQGLTYHLADRQLRAIEGGQCFTARLVPHVRGSKPLILWAVDTVREEVGPGPVAWLEEKVFGARDIFKRTAYSLWASESDFHLKGSVERGLLPALDLNSLERGKEIWPPPKVPSLWDKPSPGEGEWRPVSHPFLGRLKVPSDVEPPPAYFYETFIRPDPKRPYAKLMVIAMDMRQLELGMQAGYEDPEPLTGPPGSGRLPNEPRILERVVATFNGAFKTTHGAYGMMVNHRVLLPPMPGAASVVITEDGRTGLGSWPQPPDVPAGIMSYRQNLDPLVEDGRANPTGRYIWGWQLEGTSVLTQRTALCVTPAGQLYYAWAEEIDGPTLGKALRQAGCAYGIHLDMNPGHCGFVYTQIVDSKANKFHLKVANGDMGIAPDKYVRWSAKDFFYVMLREPTPRNLAGVAFAPDPGAQPLPAWLAAVHSGKVTLGGLDIELRSFASDRVGWLVRAGTKEPTLLDAAPMKTGLVPEEAKRVIAAIGLGHGTSANGGGFAFDGRASLPMRAGYATLVAQQGQALKILAPGQPLEPAAHGEAVQLPVLAEGGDLTPLSQEHGALRQRGALCVTSTGQVLIALARHDSSAPLASFLLKAGCERVVDLDRGSHHPAFVHRTGTQTPPIADYEPSVLYALAVPMTPTAFRWKAKGSRPSTRPTGYDVPAPAGRRAAQAGPLE